jgi:hypothetical protein
VVAAIALLVPLLILLMIETGTARIAPAAENHAGLSRLLGLLVVLVTGGAALLSGRAVWLIVLGQVLVTPFCIAALCEVPPTVPAVFRSLVSRGPIGCLLARIFTPGWHTGFLYVLLVWAILAIFWRQSGLLGSGIRGLDPSKPALSLASFGVSLLLPAVIAPALSRKRPLYFFGFFLLCALAFFLASALAATGGDPKETLTTFLPPVAVFAPGFSGLKAAPRLVWMASLGFLVLAVYASKSRSLWRQSKKLRTLAQAKLPAAEIRRQANGA